MLSFVVENSLIPHNTYSKSPRHLILNKLVNTHILRLFLKHFNSRFFNKLIGDSLWYHYKFFSYINKSTTSVNLSITSYYFFMLMLLEKKLKVPYNINSTRYIFHQASVLALPINKRVNNFTLISLLIYSFSNYPVVLTTFAITREYVFLLGILRKYLSLNFYYLRVYAH